MSDLRLFGELRKASFISRPNRFIIECLLEDRTVRAYLPNPGRLWELLFPGTGIYLSPNNSPEVSTAYTCVAVEREGRPILLHTHHTNTVARWLIDKGMIPSFAGYHVERAEVTCGNSRFDLLLKKGDEELLLEVKSCTLFGRETAMFPDAITARGKKHILELAELSRKGRKGGVLFVVHSPTAKRFMPEYHTDLEFSRALCEVRKDILIKAVGVRWRDDLTPAPEARELEIPWPLIEKEAHDRGSCIIILRLNKDREITVGALGSQKFPKGYYLYVGSAIENLTARISRHQRMRKNPQWPIDHLRNEAEFIAGLSIRASERLECSIAGRLREITEWSVPGFGSSDCGCDTHLFGMSTNPIGSPAFIGMLQFFRMDRLT
ncbi:MAG: DNA/RNA nuclease SfsA [Nitrospirales bacterium]|nr:DNA/RNA nuclease SfsA [Nitrospirales bacterium]